MNLNSRIQPMGFTSLPSASNQDKAKVKFGLPWHRVQRAVTASPEYLRLASQDVQDALKVHGQSVAKQLGYEAQDPIVLTTARNGVLKTSILHGAELGTCRQNIVDLALQEQAKYHQ